MTELIERLEKATEPDRKLFEAAYVACFGEVDWGPDGNWHPFRKFLDLLDVGAWTDAAVTLVANGCEWKCGYSKHVPHTAEVMDLMHPYRGVFVGESDASRAIAICIAALKERAAFSAGEGAGS